MQINLTELEPCKFKVEYHADPEQISSKRSDIVSVFKKAPVPGFRPGKASADAVRIHYREQIDASLKRALAEEAFHNTLFEKQIKPHGAPRYNYLFLGDGKFHCEFEVYTKPDFSLTQYKGVEVPKPHASEDATVLCEKMMQDLRVRFGDVTPYTELDVVQHGDTVLVNYEGSVDGEVSEGLTATGEQIQVGNSPLPSFDENLLGMKVNEVKEFSIVAPEESLPSLSGKTVTFKVTLVMGTKTTPCPLDDTLAAKLGKKTFAELRELVLGSAQAQLANKQKEDLLGSVTRKLVENTAMNVPNWMSLSEAQYLAHASKVDWNTLADVDKEKYLQLAEKNVKLSLILDKIRDEEPEAQLTDQEVFDVVKRTLLNNKPDISIDEVIKNMNSTGYLQILFSRIRDEHTLDFVLKNAKIVE